MSAAITAGMPIMIMPAVTSMYQAKIGILPSVMPGARVFRMPTMSSTAAATAEISTKPRPSTQTSVLMPGRVLGAGERRVHEPAAIGRDAEEQAGEHQHAADGVAPVAEGREPRERHVARAEHARQQQHRDRLDDRHREQEHHHGAVHREELVVGVGVEEASLPGYGELDAHEQREHAGAEEEQKAGGDVEDADRGCC